MLSEVHLGAHDLLVASTRPGNWATVAIMPVLCCALISGGHPYRLSEKKSAWTLLVSLCFLARQSLEKCGIIEAMSSLHIRLLGDPPASIWTLNAGQVRDLTASLSPTPGGGSIAAFTATLGLALVQKGVSISLKRVGEDVVRGKSLIELSDSISSGLISISGLADEDSQAFQNYVEARSLPRTTEEEKALRNAAMEATILNATRIPLMSARKTCVGLDLAKAAVKLSDVHLLSDVFGGAILMQAAVKALLLNVIANVSLLSNEGLRADLEMERMELEQLSIECGESVGRAYQARLSDSKDVPAAFSQ
jgi:formiminotetrahydrofolate cyclodeaminase